jgi:predicted ATPase
MNESPSRQEIRPGLLGRRDECGLLDRLVAGVRAGQGQVLVLRGEAGAGKTALLNYLLKRAGGCQVIEAAGAESEMELAFAALHQLCAPFLDRLERLPGPQRDALDMAFGLRDGHGPDRFLASLGFSTLLSEVAGEQPLICVVDDAQWLDEARPVWTTTWPGWPSWWSEGWPTTMPGCCCPRP